MSSPITVDVVMPVRDGGDTVEAAITSALQQRYDPPPRVIVAHGPSTDGTAEVLARMQSAEPRLLVIDNPTGGRSAGLNLAIAASDAAVVVRCDAHSTLPPGYVESAVALLESSGAAVVGGVQHGSGRTPVERAIAIAQASPLGTGGSHYRTGTFSGDVDTVYLGVYRRDILDHVGGFDETLEGNEDYDLHWRIRQAGGRVRLESTLRVAYRPRSTFRALWRQYYRYGAWKRAMLRRHPRSLRLRQLAPQALVVALVGSGVLGATQGWGWAVPFPAVYGLLLGGTAVHGMVTRRQRAALLMAPALATMHLAWGLGFLTGRAVAGR